MGKINRVRALIRNYGMSNACRIVKNKILSGSRAQRRKAIAMIRDSIKELKLNEERKAKFNYEPVFGILVPLYNTDSNMLKCVIESVIKQTYSNWELCIYNGSGEGNTSVDEICREYCNKDARIKYQSGNNLGISENTNKCAEMTDSEYLGLLDHDDYLHPSALYEVAKALNETKYDFIYTDEVTFKNKITNIVSTNFKPDYSPESIRCNNYICHFTVFSKDLYNRTGGFNKKYDGSQDHALILELTDKAKKVHHIPEILYFWRLHKESVGLDINAKKYAIDAGIRAVKDFLTDKGIEATVESSEIYPTIYRIKYAIKDTPKVSIIILNKDHKEDLERCITSLKNSTYDNY